LRTEEGLETVLKGPEVRQFVTFAMKWIKCEVLIFVWALLSGSCRDRDTAGQINALDRVQNKASEFAHQRNDLNWETLTERRKIARICAVFKAYTEERAWKAISDRLQKPYYQSRVHRDRKIRSRKQNTTNKLRGP
jgi:hypothetical protein